MIIPELAKKYIEKGWWTNRTFIDVAGEAIRKNADREAIVDGDKRFTFRQLDEMATNLARNLKNLGLRKGDVVSVELPNCYQISVIHLALAKIGGVFNPIIPIYLDAEVKFILNQVKSAIMVVPSLYRNFDYAEMMQRLRPDLPHLKYTFVSGETSVKDVISLDEMIENKPGIELAKEDIDPYEVRAIIFTSGTTAEPKGVQHLHNDMLLAVRDYVKTRGFTENDAYFCPLPMCHQMGLNWALDGALVVGYKVVLQDRWDPEVAISLLEKEKCTFTVLAPTMLLSILELPSAKQHDTRSIKFCECTAAPITAQLIERAWNELGWHRTYKSYGMSEVPDVSQVPFDAPIEEVRAKGATTDGKIVDTLEVKIVDADRKALGLDEEGELALRGPQVFIGYTNPKLNEECFDEEGYYYTGDIVRIDRDGYLEITGRVKDIIIRGGENISAKEIEDLLYKHPKIAEVAVVAMPDVQMGEKACAYVKLKEGIPQSEFSLEDVTSFLLEQGLSKRKLPEHSETVTEFPRSSIGKIIKAELRNDIAKKLGLPPVRGR
ncbi:AMP-binding protein [Chloroflexota bacterium]